MAQADFPALEKIKMVLTTLSLVVWKNFKLLEYVRFEASDLEISNIICFAKRLNFAILRHISRKS